LNSNLSLEVSKKDFTPSFEATSKPVNLLFGCATSTIVTAFLCFHLIVSHCIPIGIEKYFPIEEKIWSKFAFTMFLAMTVFFYSGLYGVVASAILVLSAIIDIYIACVIPPSTKNNESDLDSLSG